MDNLFEHVGTDVVVFSKSFMGSKKFKEDDNISFSFVGFELSKPCCSVAKSTLAASRV